MNIYRKFKKIIFGTALLTLMMVFFGYTVESKKNKKVNEISVEDSWAQDQLSQMTLEEKIGQFFMVPAYSNQGDQHLAEVEKLVTNEKVGGIIFFQGEKDNLKSAISRFQKVSKTPLLIGMDAEWGIQMRIFGESRFPYAYTIGAANDLSLSEKIGEMMGQECRELGIHLNFSPVADVNSNPDNPVIGFRSYGENPQNVADHVAATVKGIEESGVIASIKHFPGHGDTDKDSHLELPTVSNSLKSIKEVDLLPFKSGIKAGASSVMIGHLNVPSIDNSGLPSSLSKRTIQGYLQDSLGFEGLVISDALNMKAVADKYGKTDVVVKAFEAGCDILLFPESINEAINAITSKVKSGKIPLIEVDKRCLKVLKAKYKYVLNPKSKNTYTEGEIELARKQVYEKSITVLKNEGQLFPLKKLDKKIARVSIGAHTAAFRDGLDRFSKIDHFHFYTIEEAKERLGNELEKYDLIITALHANTVRPRNDFGMPNGWREWISSLPKDKEKALILFGNPLALKDKVELKNIQTIVLGYENNPYTLERMSQFVFGAIEANGKLPFTVSKQFPIHSGIKVESTGRLKFSQPEELGIDPKKFAEIDRLAKDGITKGAFPGCQIVVAVEGKIIYQKSFGTQRYEDSIKVKDTDVYDIASVTKIAGSTMAIMKLESEGKFSIDKKIKDYLPELTGGSPFGDILLKDMMTHQAGLTAWIPFYKRTMKEGELNPEIYSKEKKEDFENQVAKGIWIKNSYTDSIYKRILNSELGPKKYEYSDLGYYFIKKIVEKQSNQSLDEYLLENLYEPMGLQHMRYRPLSYFPLSQIVPTEKDMAFRKQQVHGFVHDPGAAMLGGVGGHAGLFSNATDLASLMQLLLNKGTYGETSYINKSVVDLYTKCQFCPTNRRGIGFDRPKNSGGGTCHEVASQSSFGHSGFTGTLAWADPEYQINYVFLSNRVYQDQDNWKIRDMNIRTNIQKAIYDAVLSAKKL
jgi:beta-glucosidase-like glycosyl hydrolase/CubicO group peptidase (beta-lactamase class C family)